MTAQGGSGTRTVADNDIILKATCYGVSRAFWPNLGTTLLGVLGAARYVVAERIERVGLTRGSKAALSELAEVFRHVEVLEPADREIDFAADLEVAAQRRGLPLDAGESQLVAIVLIRELDVLQTGDKRAIAALEGLLDEVPAALAITGRVACLEQIVRRAVVDDQLIDVLLEAVCREEQVDMALTMCFSCHSSAVPTAEQVVEGLDSYIAALRRTAQRVLVA